MTIAITDVVLRDAHQSLFATRLRLDDMLPIAAQLDDVGYGICPAFSHRWRRMNWSAKSKNAMTCA